MLKSRFSQPFCKKRDFSTECSPPIGRRAHRLIDARRQDFAKRLFKQGALRNRRKRAKRLQARRHAKVRFSAFPTQFFAFSTSARANTDRKGDADNQAAMCRRPNSRMQATGRQKASEKVDPDGKTNGGPGAGDRAAGRGTRGLPEGRAQTAFRQDERRAGHEQPAQQSGR